MNIFHECWMWKDNSTSVYILWHHCENQSPLESIRNICPVIFVIVDIKCQWNNNNAAVMKRRNREKVRISCVFFFYFLMYQSQNRLECNALIWNGWTLNQCKDLCNITITAEMHSVDFTSFPEPNDVTNSQSLCKLINFFVHIFSACTTHKNPTAQSFDHYNTLNWMKKK